MDYRATQVRAGRRTYAATGSHRGVRSGKRSQAQERERIRLTQLLVCVILFFAVFVGKGVFPDKILQVRDNIMSLLTNNVDLRGAFEQLGTSLSEETDMLTGIGAFCVEVFGTGSIKETEEDGLDLPAPKLTNLLESEIQYLSGAPTVERLSEHYLYTKASDERIPTLQILESNEGEPETVEKMEVPAAVPTAGTVLLKSDYDGRELPNNYTMDQLSLGELDTVTPVLGHLNSEYGYRDHPINGVYQFHGGVDIGGQNGDPIAAFAEGTVEYIGEDNSYGLYLQIDHGNGIKSFYAHCKKLLASKGDHIEAGETIALVGSSGAATGPHLHLEIKYNQMHLNPAYYLEFLTV